LFIFHAATATTYIVLYVGDIILIATTTTLHHGIIASLSSKFVMSDLGPLHHFLILSVHHTSHGLFLTTTICPRAFGAG
jgi:hypothetical protein